MIVFLIILATIASTTLGGLFAIRFKDHLHLILGFSAGAVLGVALFDLLPESIDLASKTYSVGLIMALAAIGFSLYMILDRTFSIHAHGKDHCENPTHAHETSGLGASALIFHSMLDGIAIGLAFNISSTIGWVVAAAVLTHDFSDGINTVSMVMKNQGKDLEAYGWLAADALAPAIGVALTSFVVISESALGLVLAVFVGLFLYISASDLIPESQHQHPTAWTTISTILGMLVIYLAVHFAG